MLTFTPDGDKVLVANEGEPNDDYSTDPEGSVSVIDIDTSGGTFSAGVTSLDFTAFNSREDEIEDEGGRIFGPNVTTGGDATVAQDLEPEYIAVSPDGKQAFVTLQENNAVAIIDLETNTISDVQGLGFKDHDLPGNELDASNRDNIDGNLQNWPVKGMYQPDSIVSYTVDGETYYVTANEGDARDYVGYSEEVRVEDLTLDSSVFSDATLQDETNLGRLKTTTANGDADGDGLFEKIYAYGARSMSIWDAQGELIGDTGSTIESVIATMFPDQWEEGRSDDKGPEPEALEVLVLNGVPYALLGLERADGFMVFDISNPTNPIYLDYIFNDRDEAPEGIDFALMAPIPSQGLYNDWGYVAVANEDSNTTVLYRVSQVPEASTLALLGLGLGLVSLRRRTQSRA